MHLKVFVKLKKTLKIISSGQKNPKTNQKTQKKNKKTKKPTGLGFFLKKPGLFPTLPSRDNFLVQMIFTCLRYT
jgi:hypothetical protein